ncbi:hypothetical protein NBRC116583_06650 [Arenicella sp. 4NH20-0111]|uniref:hypothetical protein n=1 Tax=Arenicella sp. 4NH20-0111 TaxID=3127648 RepID=UPI00310204C1
MKENEVDYLNKLFASSSDVTDEAEVDYPLVDVPEGLSDRLLGLADSDPKPVSEQPSLANVDPSKLGPDSKSNNIIWGVFNSWTRVTSIAASLFVAVMGFQFHQQQQTIKQLEQAQADLATALEYLGEANRIARSQVIDSLNDNMKKAGVEPALKIGRNAMQDALEPNTEQPELDKQTQRHSL